jgi:hypothetical protein
MYGDKQEDDMRMLRSRVPAVFAAFLLLSVWPLQAADVAGKWAGTTTTGEGESSHIDLVLKVENNTVTGDFGPNADRRFQIVSGFEAVGLIENPLPLSVQHAS